MDTKSNAMIVNTPKKGIELKEGEGKDLLVHCKRIKYSKPTVQPRQGVEVSDMDNKTPEVLLHKASAANESASSRLRKICSASGWKEPTYDFEEQGPPHKKLFKCKVTVHVEGVTNTVLECFSDQQRKKKAAREHAAQGAVWLLGHLGR